MNTPEQFIDLIRHAGFEAGDSMIVHSSYKTLAPFENGPAGVVDALIQMATDKGNVMFPAFNYSGNLASPYFDLGSTPCKTGIIPELGRQHPRAVRSEHPSHSVAVIGPDADALTRDHLSSRTFGINSPVDRLAKMGGWILLLGVGHIANSTIHVGEEYAAVPKDPARRDLPTADIQLSNGEIIAHQLDTSASCSLGFDAIEEYLSASDSVHGFEISGQGMQLMRAQDVIDATVQAIHENVDALLCARDDCVSCNTVRLNAAES